MYQFKVIYVYPVYSCEYEVCFINTMQPYGMFDFFFEQDISFWSNDTVLFHQSKTPGIPYPNDFVHWHHLTFIEGTQGYDQDSGPK